MPRSARSSVLVALLALLALTGAPAAEAGAVALADGVVVDPAAGVAYLMGAEGNLEAVRTSAGTVMWTSPSVAKPLAVAQGLVVAQAEPAGAGRLDVVSFEAASGAPGSVRAAVELPADVTAALRDGVRSSFRASARPEAGSLLISWRATHAAGGLRGYVPAPSEGAGGPLAGAPEVEQQAGSVHLDLDSGVVSAAAAPAAGAPTAATVPAADLPGATGTLFLSADGRHVLASERQESDDPFASYRWTIYARDTGAELGQVTSISSFVPFVVADGRLVYVAQRTIRAEGRDVVDRPFRLAAIDLASGEELWSRAASDPAFRGPFPP